MQQRVINEWKRDRVTCGSQFSREGFSAWLGKKVKAKMEGHLLPSLKLSRNIFLQDFQQSSKRLVSKVLFFGFVFFFSTERLQHFVENEPWKQQDMWMDVFHKIFYTSIH